jgi:hypothetical protein
MSPFQKVIGLVALAISYSFGRYQRSRQLG